ncbi:MAG: glycosyltransferase family 2 protein [Lachnospiraceae bacterium]|nr:glycosyltransferase family 2 protein [Lachnospiraceae bacterium]
MTLNVLLSAMNLKDLSIIDQLNIKSDAVVINQCDREADEVFEDDGKKVRFISRNEKGLSKSRNLAVNAAWGDICLYCDNDVKYSEDYENAVKSAFERHPDADIIVFFIKRKERLSPVYKKESRLGYLKSMKIFSPEIAFRRESVIKAGLMMDEDFGAGAKYSMGEENIFLFEAKQKGLKVWYVPYRLATLIETESTWFKGYTEEFFRNRGAGYYRMTKSGYFFLCLQFAIRKRALYSPDGISFLSAMKFMMAGKSEYVEYKNIHSR